MSNDLQHFLMKLAILLVITPFVGLYMVKLATLTEEAWKKNDKKKKWVVMCTIFAILAGFSGWFR